MGKVGGIDMGVAITMARELGYEVPAVIQLLDWCQAGMMRAIREITNDGG